MRVDRNIEDLVVALRLLGFRTTASCAGHLRRRTTGPYVMFECEAARAIMGAATVPRDVAVRQAEFQTLHDARRLRAIVDAFSRARPAGGLALEIRPVGHHGYRLCVVHADFSTVLTGREHAAEVRGRQQLMDEFLRFLVREELGPNLSRR